jgi:hypothetical protein
MSILTNRSVVALLIAQHQAISRAQLLELGLTAKQAAASVGRELTAASRGVYTLTGSSESWEQRLWVKRLQINGPSALFREAAAAANGFASFRPGPVRFVVPHGWHADIPGVHQTRDPFFSTEDLYENLPVTTPAQTFCDLAATTPRARLRDSIDDAFARRLVTPLQLVETFDALRRPGKAGFGTLGAILDDWRDGGRVPTRSELEKRTLALFARYGGPAPIVGWPFPSRTDLPHIADFADPEALLVLETDGRKWHDRIKQKKRDVERDANAARHGIQILRVLWEHVVGDPKGTWQTYMDVRAVRLRQLGKAHPSESGGASSPSRA